MTQIEVRPRRNRWIVAALAASLSLVSLTAWAFGGRHHGGGPGEFHERMLNEMLDAASATDEQRAQITEIMRAAHEEDGADARAAHQALREQVLAVLTAETVDAAALDALRVEHQQQMDQHLARMTQALAEAAAVLSQEQRVAVADALRERFERHGEGPPGPYF